MISRNDIERQLQYPLESIDIDGLGPKYAGKVRDCYTLVDPVAGDQRVLIASDRLSAFDVVLTTIPFKGRLLTQMAAYWFEQTASIVPNHVISYPHPNVVITREVEILPVEVIIRGYLAGSAWRDYQAGRPISGITFPAGMKKSQRLEQPLITPSTKAEKGKHDEPISSEEIIRQGLVEKNVWDQVCQYAQALFEFGSRKAAERGLIFVDTKYEFGILRHNGKQEVLLADEIHTQDSSRFWLAESYQERFEQGEDPVMLDKEFVRRRLIELGYMGEGTPPILPDSFRVDVAEKYIEAFETITGQTFEAEVGPVESSIKQALEGFSTP